MSHGSYSKEERLTLKKEKQGGCISNMSAFRISAIDVDC